MNKKLIIGAGLLAGMMLLSGCTGSQPAFNPGDKAITFVNGKPYAIPYSANYDPMDEYKYKMYKSVGYTCNMGNVIWGDRRLSPSINNAKNEDEIKSIIVTALRQGKIGCAKPLSKQEYQYRLNQQNQNSANSRAYNQQQNYNNQVQSIQTQQQIQNRTDNIMRNVTNTNIRMSNGYY